VCELDIESEIEGTRKLTVGILAHQVLERLWELLGSLAILEEHDLELSISLSPGGRVVDRTYSAVSITETLDLGLILSEDGSWQSLALSLHIVVPELVMLSPEEDDGAAGLDRERRGSVLDGMVDTHDNAAVGDGRLLCKGEDGAADLDGLEEWSLVSHCYVFCRCFLRMWMEVFVLRVAGLFIGRRQLLICCCGREVNRIVMKKRSEWEGDGVLILYPQPVGGIR